METRRETREEIQRRRAARRRRRFIRYTVPRALLALLLIGVICILIACMSPGSAGGDTTDPTETSAETTQGTEPSKATEASTEPTEPAAFYELTDEERDLIERVLSAECRGEPYEGQVAVAQCLLNACLKHDIRPAEAIVKYKYTKHREEPTASIRRAVAAVFDRGEGVTDEPILYFYNPAIGCGDFHETQDFVLEIQNHRFFKEAE